MTTRRVVLGRRTRDAEAAAEEEPAAPFTFVLGNVGDEEAFLEQLTCQGAKDTAATNSGNRALVEHARQSCRTLAALVARARRDMDEYVDLLFAHVARGLPDGWAGQSDGDGGRVLDARAVKGRAHMEPYVRPLLARAVWTGECVELHRRSPPPEERWYNGFARVCAMTVPEVRDQVNALVAALRIATDGQAYQFRMHVSSELAADMALVRLSRVTNDARGASDGITAALRNGLLAPGDLKAALAEAIQLSTVMNASAEGLYDAEDDEPDTVLRAVGVDPTRLAWIEATARVMALDDPRRQLKIGDARRLMRAMRIDPRAPLPPAPPHVYA